MAEASLYDELGGEAALRRIVDRFVDRVFDDVMIGFLFSRASRERVKSKEFEFAAAHLGALIEYTGRPIAEAHAPHPIMGGHFMRRLQILKETLAAEHAPPRVVEHWVEHTLGLRSLVTQDALGECIGPAPRAAS